MHNNLRDRFLSYILLKLNIWGSPATTKAAGRPTPLVAAPRVGVVDVGEVGTGAVDAPAVVVDVGVVERAEPVLLRVRTVPALPAVDAARVHELRPPRGVAVVLLAHEVHIHGRARLSSLRSHEHHTRHEPRSREAPENTLLQRHNTLPGIERRKFSNTTDYTL